MDKYIYWFYFTLSTFLVGAISGYGAALFRELIAFIHNLLFYGKFSTNYNIFQHAAPSSWGIGIIFVPVIGAIIVTFLIKNFASEAKGHGVPEVMDAIHYKGGIIRPIVAIIKAFASAISIGSGGSVGREGPIIQIGATFGSIIGQQWFKIHMDERVTLIACGAAAGIAATFNTPIAGVLFAIEVMRLKLYTSRIVFIGIAVAASICINYISGWDHPFIPDLTYNIVEANIFNAVGFFIISIVIGVISAFFIWTIYYTEDLFERIFKNHYIRHIMGMFFIGLNLYVMMRLYGHYYIQGVGYATILDILKDILLHPVFLLFLAFIKILDTAVTLGSGGSGGVLSSLLFIGATLGAGFAGICNYFLSGQAELSLQLAALAGMAGMVGASTAAPITAIIMLIEMTNNMSIILPLIVVVFISYRIRLFLIKESIYTLKLSRNGHLSMSILRK